jgi:protein-L-isoaspartate O-methyltransferase
VTAEMRRDDERVAELRQRLAGSITSSRWHPVFEIVPRHLFVPRFFRRAHRADTLVDGSRPEQHDEWLAAVYSDQYLFTQYDDDDMDVCSSSSKPSIMAAMLDMLDVERGHRVLEIGTGTGYNAGLLSEHLGSGDVTTIDVDAGLVALARDRLAVAGYHPTVAVADGLHGYPANAPHDLIISTCQTWRIPDAWLRQVRRGGRIVAVLPLAFVGLDVQDDGSASGRFGPIDVMFMEMRGQRVRWLDIPAVRDPDGGDGGRTTSVELAPVGPSSGYWFFLKLAVSPHWEMDDLADGVTALMDRSDLSWARYHWGDEPWRVVQGGPRRLWDEIERAHAAWVELGSPERERFGLTVEPDGEQHVWLDDPASEHRWRLPDAATIASIIASQQRDAGG